MIPVSRGKIYFLTVFGIVFGAIPSFALSLPVIEDSIVRYYDQILTSNDTNVIFHCHNRIKDLAYRGLRKEGGMTYPFKRLQKFSTKIADDKEGRLFFWMVNVPGEGWMYAGYFAIKEGEKTRVHYLEKRRGGKMPLPSENYNNTIWYGAYYYDIVSFKTRGNKRYLLLGWRNENVLFNSKIAEIVQFHKKSWEMSLPLFVRQFQSFNRVVVQYPKDIGFSMKYNPEKEFIYYDRLIPLNRMYEDNAAALSPSFAFDGYKLSKGQWLFIEDIEVNGTEGEKNKSVSRKKSSRKQKRKQSN